VHGRSHPHHATHSPRERSGPASKHGDLDGDSPYALNVPPAERWLIGVMIVVGVLLAAFLFPDELRRSRWRLADRGDARAPASTGQASSTSFRARELPDRDEEHRQA